jgi:hypothetical protein
MSSRSSAGDVSALLYLVPFALSGIYALVLWAGNGVSPLLPASVYLAVTRDPLVFAVGTLAVLLGATLDVTGAEAPRRPAKASSTAGTLQKLAGASLVLAFVSALYANGFDPVGASSDFVVGRYDLVFPAMLVLFSFLISAQFSYRALSNPKALGIVSLLLVPVVLREVGKLNAPLGLAGALLFLALGVTPFLLRAKKPKEGKAE